MGTVSDNRCFMVKNDSISGEEDTSEFNPKADSFQELLDQG